MQSTPCEMLGWMKHKLESRFLGEISVTSDIHDTTFHKKRKETAELLELERGELNSWLKTQHSEN